MTKKKMLSFAVAGGASLTRPARPGGWKMTLETLIAAIETKTAELARLRARAPGGTTNFDHSQDLELTYTSNAIEGNTLTAVETTMVIEHGITVAGKPLRDHLEALDHFEAI